MFFLNPLLPSSISSITLYSLRFSTASLIFLPFSLLPSLLPYLPSSLPFSFPLSFLFPICQLPTLVEFISSNFSSLYSFSILWLYLSLPDRWLPNADLHFRCLPYRPDLCILGLLTSPFLEPALPMTATHFLWSPLTPPLSAV